MNSVAASQALRPNGTDSRPLLLAQGLSKHYGHVTALDNVDVEIRGGEILALVGDNGAGKSTLVGILAGAIQPDAGEIWVEGRSVRIDSPRSAEQLGIATVFQDLALVNQRDVASNLFLGREPVRLGFVIDRRFMLKEARRTLERLQVSLPSVRVLAGDLSGGQRQAVAVARAVMRGTRILLLDEPTAALGVREAGRVIELIKRLRSEGLAILLISHNVENVFEVADRAVILRLGRNVASHVLAETTRDEVVKEIVGLRRESG